MSDSHHEHAQDHGHAPCPQGQCGHAPAAETHAAASHGHDDHGHAHDDHGHGHDDHGHGHGGHSPWVDYNAKPPEPSKLPPIGGIVLAVIGVILAGVLAFIVNTSLALAGQAHSQEHHDAETAPEHH